MFLFTIVFAIEFILFIASVYFCIDTFLTLITNFMKDIENFTCLGAGGWGLERFH